MKALPSKRLTKLAEFTGGLNSIADIGSDHSYLAKYLLDNKKIKYALCVEAVDGPFKRSRLALDSYIKQKKADVILSDGICDVSPNVIDGIVLAGMGGNLILEILNRDLLRLHQFKRIILQPQNAQTEIRRFLIHNDFEITAESIVYEKEKFYEIISASPNMNATARKEIFYEIPLLCVLNKDPQIIDFIRYKQYKLTNIIQSCTGKKSNLAQRQIKDAQTKINELEKIIQCL
jgi:tRNA (adenine22-N1)-methyltransferase